MANVWFTSDLHFGHKNIQKFRLEVLNEEDNNYFNLCVENLWKMGYPSLISLDQIRSHYSNGRCTRALL